MRLMQFKSGFTDENSTVRQSLAPGPLRQARGFYYQEFGNFDAMPLKDDPFGVGEDKNQVSSLMEFLILEEAQAIAYYDHPYWGKYPAITLNEWGKGSVLYEGCEVTDAIQETILMRALDRAGGHISGSANQLATCHQKRDK